MAYNPNLPADDGFLAEFPPEMREQLRAIIEDMIVNAGTLKGLSTGNASGNIPISNGTLNTNLNADKVDGLDASAFASASHGHSVATGSSNGFMSNTDKQKLDGIQTGAEVNQNAFSNVLVNGTTIQADSKTDTLELVAGANISLTPDATNDRVTIANTYSYTHPTGDGNLHVPATGTGNNGKVLKAGASAGSIAWGTLSASDITNTPAGNISATTVQAAINELDSEKVSVSEVVTTATANKILKLNSNAKLPASITGNADGNAATATKLQTARTISLTGDVTGSTTFDGSGNASIATTIANNSHTHTLSNITDYASYDAAHTFAANGYQKLSNGLILQWGVKTTQASPMSVVFPIAFPTACLVVVASYASTANDRMVKAYAKTKTGFTLVTCDTGGSNKSEPADWLAIGY